MFPQCWHVNIQIQMQKKFYIISLILLISLIGCSSKEVYAPAKVPGVKYIKTASLWGGLSASEYMLDNGLRIIIVPDKQAPVYALQVWFDVGSRDEEKGITGIAHLFEHLMFKETSNMTEGEFDKTITSLGGKTNASTWVDWTHYRQELPAGTLETIIKFEADRMVNLVLNNKQLESEREVVLNEKRFRVDNSPQGKMYVALYKEAFTDHPYRWPTIGWTEDIKSYTIKDLQTFYKTFYSPNNATMVVVGDFDPREALNLIKKYYVEIPASDIPERKLPIEPPQKKEKKVTLKEPVEAEKLVAGWHVPSIDNPDLASILLLNQILFNGKSSRLYQVLVEETQIATSVSGWVPEWNDPGLWELEVSLRGKHSTAEADKVILGEVERFKNDGVSSREIQKAKNQYEAQYYGSVSNASGKATVVGHYQVTVGDFTFSQELLKRVNNVTQSDINRVAKKYLVNTNRTVVYVKRKS